MFHLKSRNLQRSGNVSVKKKQLSGGVSMLLILSVLLSCIAIGVTFWRMVWLDKKTSASAADVPSSMHLSGEDSGSTLLVEEDTAHMPIGWELRVYGGKLAVFQMGETVPSQVFAVDWSTFPPMDQALLQEGIYAKTEEELRQLIEDYTS